MLRGKNEGTGDEGAAALILHRLLAGRGMTVMMHNVSEVILV